MYSITFVFFHVAKTISSVFGLFPAWKQPLKAGKLTLTASRGLRPLEAIKTLIVRPLKAVFGQENGQTHLKSFPLYVKWQMNEVKYYDLTDLEKAIEKESLGNIWDVIF